MRTILVSLVVDRRAATAIEYALLAALLSLACVYALYALGFSVGNMFNFVTLQVDPNASVSVSSSPPPTLTQCQSVGSSCTVPP